MVSATSKGSGQPAYTYSLIRAFNGSRLNICDLLKFLESTVVKVCFIQNFNVLAGLFILVLGPDQACADPEEGTGGLDPLLKNRKNIWFLSSTGPDPLKNHKATILKPAFNVGSSSACQ